MDARQLESLTQRLESRKADRARAEGACDQLKGRLKAEFGVSTVEEAETLLENLQTRVTTLTGKVDAEASRIAAEMSAAGF